MSQGKVSRPLSWTGFADPEWTKIVEQASVARIEQARVIAKQAGAKRAPNIDLETNDLSP